MLIEQLSTEDKNLMADWIRWYGISNRDFNSFPRERFAPIEHILRAWEASKGQFLFNMFGGQFILEKEVSYQRPKNLLEDQIEASLVNGDMKTFRDKLLNKIEDYCYYYSDQHSTVRRMFRSEMLSENRWTNSSTSITFGDTKFDIPHGAKIMKVLNKLAKYFHLESYFEDFRIAHSQILNQKLLTGTLCLSIHPFDFMTLSDNDYDWDSCMSWESNGCYRTGTVECMNSPYMVVAYLKGDKPFRIDRQYWAGNKKWRELFVVHPHMLCNVKAYPYQNNVLSQLALEWLRELAAHNLKWDVSYDPMQFNVDTRFTYHDKREYCFDLCYNFMYNDFDTANTCHYIIVTQDWQESTEEDWYHRECINLSGPNICMCCGNIWYPHEGHEDQILCRACDPGICCSCCGEEIDDEDDQYHVDGDILCHYCFDEQASTCMVSEEYYYNDDMTQVYCVPIDDDLSGGYWTLRSRMVHNRYIQENGLRHEPMFTIDTFHKAVTEDGEVVHYVNMSECTNYALEDGFGLWSIWDRNRYLENYESAIKSHRNGES